MQGILQEEKMEKNGRQIERKLNDDRHYTAADGSEISVQDARCCLSATWVI